MWGLDHNQLTVKLPYTKDEVSGFNDDIQDGNKKRKRNTNDDDESPEKKENDDEDSEGNDDDDRVE